MVLTSLRNPNSISRPLIKSLFRRSCKSRGHALRQAGFSLIELVVVCGVIAIISGLMLVSNNAFGGQVLLQNLAYDIALTLRQAQVYGISVQRFGSGTYDASYGMHFDSTSGNSSVYPLFADAVSVNGVFDPDAAHPLNPAFDETVKITTIGGGFRIYKLCVPAGTDAATCTCVASGTSACNTVDIVFRRPDPDACISADGVASMNNLVTPPVCISTNASARIVVRAPKGNVSSIVVYKNGQISVQKGK